MFQLIVEDTVNNNTSVFNFKNAITPIQAYVFLHCHTYIASQVCLNELIEGETALEIDHNGCFAFVGEEANVKFTTQIVCSDELILTGEELHKILNDIIQVD